jgi:hypothetical protein
LGATPGAQNGTAAKEVGAVGSTAAAVSARLLGNPSVSAGASAASAAGSVASGGSGAGAATVSGPAAQGEGFDVHLEAQGPFEVGKAASVKVVLKATSPFHCNEKYPYKFTPTPGANLQFNEAVARGMNITPTEATMNVGFTATQAGNLTLAGELSFSVCTDDRCLVEKQALTVPLMVKGAS